jgi:hypothetical protein
MPRARRTKSAVHEALQRRASERPGDGFSDELGGEPGTWVLHDGSVTVRDDRCFRHRCVPTTLREVLSLARPAAAFTFWR